MRSSGLVLYVLHRNKLKKKKKFLIYADRSLPSKRSWS